MSLTLSDFKYAVRRLVKRPGLTLLSVAMLAGGLGIGLYTFAVLNTMLHGELRLPDGSSVVKIGAGSWVDIEPLDAFELTELGAGAEVFAELGGYRWTRSLVGEPSSSRSLRSVEADWSIFEFTRTRPLLGRGFVSGDNAAGAEPVAVLGYATWQAMFAGDENAVGELMRVGDRPTRIVGIMPQGYAFPENAQLWLPLGPEDLEPTGYTGRKLETYARLRPGVTTAAAQIELTSLLQRIRLERPATDNQYSDDPVAVLPFVNEGIVAAVMFWILNLLSTSILMLAAVNVGNLLLARTNERIKEIGVRIALGAPRLRLIVQTTLENAILCVIGGAFALFLAAQALKATDGFVRAFDGLPFWWTFGLDRDVVAAAGVFLLLTVLAVSVLPALCVTGVDPNLLLRDGTRTGAGRGTGRLSRELVTLQVALISAVLVVGSAAAVIAKRAATFDNGLDTARLMTMRLQLPTERYPTAAQQLSLYEELLTELRGASGIAAAAIMQEPGIARFAADGREYATPADAPGAWHVVLSETPSPLGPALIEGRAFDSRDTAAGLKTAIISASLARAQWPGELAVGRRIDVRTASREPEPRTIVGVVDDIIYDPLGQSPIGRFAIYVPITQFTGASTRILVRPLTNETSARSAMLTALARADPELAPDIRRYDETADRVTLVASAVMRLFVGCGLFAALLAISGIYGMSSNAVVLRSHEIGLRRAVGASGRDIVATFLRQGVRQLARGLGVSAALSAFVLLAINQGFSLGAGTMALLGAAVLTVVSACVLLSIYLAVRGVARLEPSAALRAD
jgi:predicted permease